MKRSLSPSIDCCLTDKCGTILCPYSRNAITHAVQRVSKCMATVQIQGYVAIFKGSRRLSSPIPFCIMRDVCIDTPKDACLHFIVQRFCCCCKLLYPNDQRAIPQIETTIEIITAVCSCPDAHAKRTVDCTCFKSKTVVQYYPLLKAAALQYTALSDGQKREYTDRDALPEYEGSGILAPDSVSIYNLYVNGMLQPRENYAISEGHLYFRTRDLPPQNAPIVLEFITFCLRCRKAPRITNEYYFAVSDGAKRVFTNADALPMYGNKGIPAPEDISYCNLYSNGVLQPKVNYTMKKGEITLITEDLPQVGTVLALESVSLKTAGRQLLKSEVHQYNALSNGGEIYTNHDELKQYGSYGIPAPEAASYQHLFVNGPMQPSVNYAVQKGRLSLLTENAPPETAPLILQSVCVFPALDKTCFCANRR